MPRLELRSVRGTVPEIAVSIVAELIVIGILPTFPAQACRPSILEE